MPGTVDVNLHCTLEELPEDRLTDVGQDAVRPEGVETLKLTVPDSPCRLVTVTVLLPEDPALNETGVADML
ncbi:MAG: hypothetical protein AUJ08_06180 [Thaumarchaeota archaeon 13_1_40CM_3_50_5]|nr:MAG: hypothetical protein AUJ08_06180 [Thaumarchaeota archaeon 13_1_40CM_3_50_5]